MIIDKLPQQEIYNRDYLVENGCALVVSKKDMAKKIEMLVKDSTLYSTLVKSVEKVKKPNAVDEIYKILKDIKKADYSKIKFFDTKRETIKKVDIQRRLDVKNNKKVLRDKNKKVKLMKKRRQLVASN